MNNNLRIFALGGLQEIGKNCYCIEKGDDLIIVDCGIKFLNNNNLADGTIPNFDYLQSKREKIKGLFITHAHEDHIGGIIYLLSIIPQIPIYGSKFSVYFLKKRLSDKINAHEFKETISTSEFCVSFFRVTHSIPGSFGLVIETIADNLRLVITGDFKFDWTTIGEKTDLAKLAMIGKKGVDLLLSESTNAEIPGSTPSESKVIKRLESIITEATGRVIVTSFASNVYRLKKVIEIAKKTERKIILLGSSLLRMMHVIEKASLWPIDKSVFLRPSEVGKKRKKLIIFCTGSQGEEKAVLSRLAHQKYPGWKIEPDDSIILTSSPIMDNKLSIEKISNKLFALKAKIYENSKEDLLHASGHACQEDLKLMLRLINPRFLMPVHGDFRMLKSYSFLAQELGIPSQNILICENGEVVESSNKKFFLSQEKIPAYPNYVFNNRLVLAKELEENLILRKKMAVGGVILVMIFYQEKNNLFELPYIFTYGFINMEKNRNLINSWKYKTKEFCQKNQAEKNLKILVTNYIENELLKNLNIEKPYVRCLFKKII